MDTTETKAYAAGRTAHEGLSHLFRNQRMVHDLLAAWGGITWTHWLDYRQLEGRDRRGRPACGERPPAFWRAPWAGGGDEVWLLLEARCEEDPQLAFRLARRCLHLWERLAIERRSGTPAPRLPLIVPIVLYAGSEPWQGPRQALDHFWPILPGLQSFAPRAPFLLFDLQRDPISPLATETNFLVLLRALLASGSPRGVEAVLDRWVAEIDRSGDEALRRTLSRYLGDCFLPGRFPRLFAAGGASQPLPEIGGSDEPGRARGEEP